MEDLGVFVRDNAFLFQNAFSDFLYSFSNRSFSLSEHEIALEFWLILSHFDDLFDFLTIRHVLDDVLNGFFFTLTIATRINDIFGIETHQLFFT